MDRIVPHALWVGHAGDGRDDCRLIEAGIRAVVQVAIEELPLRPPRELVSLRFPLSDGGGNPPEIVALAVATLAHLIRLRVPTLVCCGAGMSRAPAIAAAALSVTTDDPPETSLGHVMRFRRGDVSPGLWSEVVGVLASRADDEEV